MAKHLTIPISADFSITVINLMLEMGRVEKFGPAISIYYNEGDVLPEWGVVFEGGDTVYSPAI